MWRSQNCMTPPRAINVPRPVARALIGGFLRAGKTTEVGALASGLSSEVEAEALHCFSRAYPGPPYRMPDIRLESPSDGSVPGGAHARAI
jgi:hypothetical protein